MNAQAKPPLDNGKHQILIVDDHPIVREGLAQLLTQEPDLQVCGGAESAADALRVVAERQPDLVVIDISLKESHGLDLIHRIRSTDENIKLLVWSMHDDKVYAERALRGGADGYVNKQERTEVVIAAIRRVLAGDIYLAPEVSEIIIQPLGSPQRGPESSISVLSNRELEVFEMIGRGMTTRLIARQLDVKPKTVEAHRENIKRKMRLKNSAELSRAAVLWVLESWNAAGPHGPENGQDPSTDRPS
jgi:DNA-binding NarL/FixJ family response regulator